MRNKELRSKIITETCKEFGVDPTTITSLLDLEKKDGNPFSRGAHSNLIKDIQAVIDVELTKRRSVSE